MIEPIIVEEAAAIDEPQLRRLYDYWNGKRGMRRAPLRSEIDPVEIPDLLGFLNLYDIRAEPRDYLVRLNGSNIAAMLRQDITGRSISEVIDGDDGERCRRAFSMCIDEMKPALVETSLGFCGNNYAIQTILALPLCTNRAQADMIVSAHAFRLKDNRDLLAGAIRGAPAGG